MSVIPKLKIVTFSIAVSLFLYMGYFAAYAVAPKFYAGQTRDPSCGPNDSTCTVSILSIGDYVRKSSPNAVLFTDSSGSLKDNSTSLSWDNQTERFSVGAVGAPSATVHIFKNNSSGAVSSSYALSNTTYTGNRGDLSSFSRFEGSYAGTTTTPIVYRVRVAATGTPGDSADDKVEWWDSVSEVWHSVGMLNAQPTPNVIDFGDGISFTFSASKTTDHTDYSPSFVYWEATLSPVSTSLYDDPFLVSDSDSNSNMFGVLASGEIVMNAVKYFFPANAGLVGQALVTDGAGNLSWTTVSRGLPPGGTAGQVLTSDGAGETYWSDDNNLIGATSGVVSTPNPVGGTHESWFGEGAGSAHASQIHTIFVGHNAGSSAVEAANSIFIGNNAGLGDAVDNLSGGGGTSILIGDNTNTGGYSNSIALGANAINTASNQFMVSPAYTQLNMRGINWTLPDVQGGAGQVLTNDGNGNLSWTTVSGGATGLIGSTSGITNITLPPGGTETWLGHLAGSMSSAIGTTFVGLSTGSNATNADYSNFMGFYAGQNASGAQQSNFIGFRAGVDATNAAASNFIGADAGNTASGASLSNFIGASAGQYATYASHSNFFGVLSGKDATNAAYSNFIGYNAGFAATNAANSIFIGNNAGLNDTVNNTSGGASILIGDNTSTGGFSDSIALGVGTVNTATNQLMIGSTTSPINSTRINGSGSTQCTITTGTGIACTSDERMKTEITDLKEVLPLLQKVKTVTYIWKDVPNTPLQVGFLAQNLEEVFPEVVATDSEGYKSVYYAQMTPILTKAVQELALKIDLLSASAGFSMETFVSTMSEIVSKEVSNLKDITINSIAAISGSFERIVAKSIESGRMQTSELCVDDICVTRDQFKQMINQATGGAPRVAAPAVTPPEETKIEIPSDPLPDAVKTETVIDPIVEPVVAPADSNLKVD